MLETALSWTDSLKDPRRESISRPTLHEPSLSMEKHFMKTVVGDLFLGTENHVGSVTFELARVLATIWYPHSGGASPMFASAGDSRHLHVLSLHFIFPTIRTHEAVTFNLVVNN